MVITKSVYHFGLVCMLIELSILLVLPYCTEATPEEPPQSKDIPREWAFDDFMRNYDTKVADERIQKRKDIKTNKDYVDAIFDEIDPTDALLSLKLDNIDLPQPDARKNLKQIMMINDFEDDPFNYRRRLYDLMKQAIYQARDEMVLMQVKRKKYREHKLYKMGFLMSKADNAVKLFTQFTYRAWKLCLTARWRRLDQTYLFEVLQLNERVLSLWLDTQLMTQLVVRNDDNIRHATLGRKDKLLYYWKFVH